MASKLEQKLVKFIKQKIKSNEYLTLREIASIFNISHTTVRRILIRNNLYDEYKSLQLVNHETKANIKYYEEQIKMWKKKYESLKKELGFENRIVEIFRKSIKPFSNRKTHSIKQIAYTDNTDSNEKVHEEPVLILSDIHYGANVSYDETMSLNVYNTEVARERILYVYSKFLKTIEQLKDGHNYSTVNLWLLGDIVEGIIHDELINDTPIADQVLEVAELLSQIIHDLSQKFPRVEVVGVVGNHGRMKQKIHFKNKYSNFDYLVYKYIEVRCSNLQNVSFFIPKSPMCIVRKFNKFNFLLRHGDGKNYSYASIPIYGIIRQSSKLQQLVSAYKDMYIHYEVLGHYHASMEIPKPLGSVIVCGSLKGIDEYSLINFLFNEPSQTMLLINSVDGVFAKIELKCLV